MGKLSEGDTKTLILDAAEQAFAELGFDAASLRRIISVAGVNLAAIHYHYGSKEALIEAVFARRVGPVNQARLERLDAIERRAGQGVLPLEEVIEALVGPALRLARDSAKGPVVMRLYGRTVAEPGEHLQKMLSHQFGGVVKRFATALQRAVPELPRDALYWRMQFIIGAMGHLICDPQRLKLISGGLCDPSDPNTAIRQLVAFLAAGMRAPLPSKRKEAPRKR
ncbi:MAG: TetR/AcrR family transcriptional regulator [Acidobacteria bacterium]|nr:TetR/AcrR family transcriptional regulator [Acidobacteriota bacterium]